MNYCTRIYVHLNGLERFSSADRTKTLKNLFQFLLWKELDFLKQKHDILSKAVDCFLEPLSPLTEEKVESLFTLGLAMKTQWESNAMKFLACDGETMPVSSGDGMAFEDVVGRHLERFYSLRLEHTVLRATLRCAWPPSAPRNFYDKECVDGNFPNHPVASENHRREVETFCKKVLKERNDEHLKMHVIMRQRVKNAQGPDIYVLTLEDNKGYLDLYQMKNLISLPSRGDIFAWCHSLGLEVISDTLTGAVVGIESNRVEMTKKSAAYSSQGITWFQSELSRNLDMVVDIRNHYLVIKQSWDDEAKKSNAIQALVEEGTVRVLTREFLEPTFSAIPQDVFSTCTVNVVDRPSAKLDDEDFSQIQQGLSDT
jgi:hypothetical protein